MDVGQRRHASRPCSGQDQGPKRVWRGLLPRQPATRQGPHQQRPPDPSAATRAGRPLSKKVPKTIRFSERMEFIGRTTSPEGEPAARADFFGTVTALMEDALLHCEEKMIAYTDQVVPLAQLG